MIKLGKNMIIIFVQTRHIFTDLFFSYKIRLMQIIIEQAAVNTLVVKLMNLNLIQHSNLYDTWN